VIGFQVSGRGQGAGGTAQGTRHKVQGVRSMGFNIHKSAIDSAELVAGRNPKSAIKGVSR